MRCLPIVRMDGSDRLRVWPTLAPGRDARHDFYAWIRVRDARNPDPWR